LDKGANGSISRWLWLWLWRRQDTQFLHGGTNRLHVKSSSKETVSMVVAVGTETAKDMTCILGHGINISISISISITLLASSLLLMTHDGEVVNNGK
jgi:hypothetical protein